MEATRNGNESGKMDSAGLSHFETLKLVMAYYAERENIEVPPKDIQDKIYNFKRDLSTHGSFYTQNFQPEDLSGVSETPEGDVNSSQQQTREKDPENSCSVLRKDASASISTTRWKCVKCRRWFKSDSALNVHIQKDCDPKTYKCQNSSSEFDRESYLKAHQMFHTGEKPYKCDQCDYTSRYKSGLKKHTERKHSKWSAINFNFHC